MPLPDVLKKGFDSVALHLSSLPDFGVEELRNFICISLATQMMDFSNAENIFFAEERKFTIGPLCQYEKKKCDQLQGVLGELEEDLKNPYCGVELCLGTQDRGWLVGQGDIYVYATLKFKKEERDSHAVDRENQMLRIFPEEVSREFAEKVSSKPGVLEEGQ